MGLDSKNCEESMDRYVVILGFVMLVVSTTAAQLAATSRARVPASAHISAVRPVARINGAVLTEADLQREISAMFPYAQQHGGKVPKSMEDTIRRGALQMIEFEELVYQEALRRNMHINVTRLDRAVQDLHAQFDSDTAFQQFLKAEFHGSSAILRRKVERSLLIDELLDQEVAKKSAISDAEVRAAYDRDPAKYALPRRVSIQTISVVIPDDATPEQEMTSQHRAEDILLKAKATRSSEEFGVLAEKNSDDDWRVMMGDHGLVEEGRMPAPVGQIAFRMKPGAVSDVIRVENSFCIVRVSANEPAKHLPFEEVKAQIRKTMQAQRVEQLRGTLNRRLRKTAKVEEFS
jgi:parvulin-like peptidyl-prolyl isomerase